jgi:cytoskeletal protein CcmA (bactofilin family)
MRQFSSLTFAVFLALTIIPGAHALQVRSGQTVVIEHGTTIDDDLVIAGQDATVNGTVNGDLIAFANHVSLRGKVTGTAVLAAQNVECTGAIGGSVYAAGQTVKLGSTVGRNVAIAGQNAELLGGAVVGRDAFLSGQSVDLAGFVKGNVTAAAGTGLLSGAVGKTAHLSLQSLTLTDTARVGGDLVYASNLKASIAPGAKVVGKVVQELPEPSRTPEAWHAFARVLRFLSFVWLLAVAALLTAILPQPMYAAAERIRTAWWWALLTGFLVLLFGIPVVLLLTVLLLPAGIIAGALWLAVIYLGQVVVAIFIGSWVFRLFAKREVIRPVLAALAGVVIIFVVEFVPVLGVLVGIAVAMLGTGALGMIIGRAIAAVHATRSEPAQLPTVLG